MIRGTTLMCPRLGMATELIFDSFNRTDSRPKSTNESVFQFYNRSSWPSMGRTSEFITNAVEQYPAADRPEMVARLRKDDHIRSAEFELLFFQLLTRTGFDVEVHPELNNGSARRPDFLLRTPDGDPMLIEAITIQPPDESGLADHAVEVLMEGLRDARNESYRIVAKVSGRTEKTPPIRKFVDQVQRWLSELGAEPRHTSATKDWKFEGLTVTLDAHPVRSGDADSNASLLTAYHRGPVMVDGVSNLRTKLQTKAGAYGKTGLPFVVAINCQNAFHNDIDSCSALLEEGPPNSRRANRGLWSAGRYSRLSGAWIFSNFSSIAFLRSPHTLYLNPGASHPVPEALHRFAHAHFSSSAGWETTRSTFLIEEAFDLPADWPGSSGPA